MKKSELNQLTQIIEHLVAKEIRKQLPTIIAETFKNMMGKPVVTNQRQPVQSIQEQIEEPVIEEQQDFKASLRELFAGTPVMSQQQVPQAGPRPMRQLAKDPVLNQILNETVSDLGARERMVGAAAFQGGYSPSLAMVPGFNPGAAASQPMMDDSEISFARNMPSMPVGRPPQLVEGQESMHIPMEAIPQGASVLDFKQHAPAAVAGALTRNYSQMMKLIDKKRGKIA
jgi:hypothetical protein